MTPMKTVIVAGQIEVSDLTRMLIEHRTPFSLKPLDGETEIFTFELTIPADISETTYDFALADRAAS